MLKAWTTSWAVSVPSIIHVIPVEDTMEHRPSQHCQCGPRKDLHIEGMNVMGVIWAHYAHDGRD